MDIDKLLFKKDNEKDTNALLMKLINSTTIPKPQKEKVLLALTDAPDSSSKIISLIEKNLGHKVNKIVPFLSSSSSSTASTTAPSSSSSKTSQSKSSSNKTVIKDSITKKTTQKHDTAKITDLTKSQWKKQNIATLVDQLRHRGVTITPEQLKGGKDENGKKMKK